MASTIARIGVPGALLFAATSFATSAAGAPIKAAGRGIERIPAPGGEVIIATARQRRSYDEIGYAPARRVGNLLYVSGVIVYRADDERNDLAAFEAQVRRAYRHIAETLKAGGCSFDDIVMMNSFHVWKSPNFAGTPRDQTDAMKRIRTEFSRAPFPAWTAIGTTGLLVDSGIVEIQVIAYIPEAKKP